MIFHNSTIKIVVSILILINSSTIIAQDVVQGPSEAFGNAYGGSSVSEVIIEFDLGPQIEPNPANHLQTELLRDVTISFKAKSGDSFATRNGTRASFNGEEVLVTELFSDNERDFSFTVNRNLVIAGTNTITLTPIELGGAIWGVTEITTSYIEALDLALSTLDPVQYGYLEDPSRFTGLRVDFKAATINENYTLQVRGWDIDRADETQVFLNGLSLGFLSVGPNNDFNNGDQFVLLKDDIRPGGNQIEFVQRVPDPDWEGIELEQWAVKDLIIEQLEADLIPVELSISADKITKNVAFNTVTAVKNLGSATSSAAVLRYYTSSDNQISRSDNFLVARSIPAINPGATVNFNRSVQTPLIDQGIYLGVCVAVVGFESDESNNCSLGLLLDNEKALAGAGVLMLLLDESESE